MNSLTTKLSEHFALAEFVRSSTAQRLGIVEKQGPKVWVHVSLKRNRQEVKRIIIN